MATGSGANIMIATENIRDSQVSATTSKNRHSPAHMIAQGRYRTARTPPMYLKASITESSVCFLIVRLTVVVTGEAKSPHRTAGRVRCNTLLDENISIRAA